MRTDDTIVGIDGVEVESVDGLQRVLYASRIDRVVSVAVLRGARKLELGLTPVEQVS